MASTYAIPTPQPQSSHSHFRHNQPGHGHSHSHSHSHQHKPSSPSKLAPTSARSAYAPRVMQNGGLYSSHARNYSLGGMDAYKVPPVQEHPDDPLNIPSFSGFPPNGAREMGQGGGNGHARKSSALYEEFTGVDYGQVVDEHKHHEHGHDHLHDGHSHGHGESCGGHGHAAKAEARSRATKFLLNRTKNWSLLQTILLEKDSRRIFYFIK